MDESYYKIFLRSFRNRPNRPRFRNTFCSRFPRFRFCNNGSERYAVSAFVFILMFVSTKSNPLETTENIFKNNVACTNVKYAFTAKEIFREDDVPQEAIPGEHLQICERGMTCCTQEMEYRLKARSTTDFSHFFKEAINEVKTIYSTRAQRFDEFFRTLLDRSKKDFHNMFLKTYGTLYDMNSYLFEDMFKDLETYYHSGNIDLTDALEKFFDRLYKKMFQVLNQQYSFTEKYLICVGEQMEALKPFGNIPKKLTQEIKRSFVATRTFYQALCVARDILKVLSEINFTPECAESLMKMSYCPHCRGLPDLKPCNSYCLGVANQCLPFDAELSTEWKNFTAHLDSLGGRLETSFNIESVVDPIDIKISEAVMTFQENGVMVSQKLFDVCGKPRLGNGSPHKRDVSSQPFPHGSSELHFEKFKFSSDRISEDHGKNSDNEEESMNAVVQVIRKKVKRTSNFWKQLPGKLCLDSGGNVSDGQDCWNGQLAGQEATEGASTTVETVESKLESSHQTAIVNQQILTLKLFSNKLQLAYNGLDVAWQDTDQEWPSSGSGSGDQMVERTSESDIYFSSSTAEPKRVHSGQSPGAPNGNPRRTKQNNPSSASSGLPDWRTFALFALVVSVRFSS